MKILCFVALLTMAVSITGTAQTKTKKDKDSYSIGVNIGKNFKGQDLDIDFNVLLKGMKDGFTGAKLEMTDDEINDTLMAIRKEAQTRQTEKAAKQGAENKKKGDEFLAANAKKDSVISLPDGLQYKIVHDGTGKSPTLEDSVTVNYRGSLTDGTEFDSSYKRGKPATFVLSNVIKGWQEALQMMKPGSIWHVVIPSNLAYGDRGMGNVIAPNAVLVFDVELISYK